MGKIQKEAKTGFKNKSSLESKEDHIAMTATPLVGWKSGRYSDYLSAI